jgi:hypothetical protein
MNDLDLKDLYRSRYACLTGKARSMFYYEHIKRNSQYSTCDYGNFLPLYHNRGELATKRYL